MGKTQLDSACTKEIEIRGVPISNPLLQRLTIFSRASGPRVSILFLFTGSCTFHRKFRHFDKLAASLALARFQSSDALQLYNIVLNRFEMGPTVSQEAFRSSVIGN